MTITKFGTEGLVRHPDVPRSESDGLWRSERMYAIAFDLDQAALKRHYPGSYPENAYDDICREFRAHRFHRQQGSVYFGDRGTLMFAISSGRHRNCLLVLQAVQYGRH
jgi:hypothetical protein